MINLYISRFRLLFIIASTIDATRRCPPARPDQLRLAFAGDDGVNVGWHVRTCKSNLRNPNPHPKVLFGRSRTTLTRKSVKGESTIYDNYTSPGVSWFHSVQLRNLKPSTLYHYRIVASRKTLASATYNFTSAPKLGDRRRPVRIGAYGDLGLDGQPEDQLDGPFLFQKALKALRIKLSEIDFVMHHGDICYADSGRELKPPLSYERALDKCQSAMSVVTSLRFYMTVPGNHEINCTEVPTLSASCPSYHKEQIPYSHRFNMPSKQSGGYLNSWYSFNYAFVHIISLDCESDFPDAPSGYLLNNYTQVNWLKGDLAALDRSVTPWVIVQCHRPWKGSVGSATVHLGGIVNCPACQQAFEQILIEHNVDIYMNGHEHWYERICLNGTVNTTNYVNPSGPVYLTNGGIGNPGGNEYALQRSNDSCVLISEPGFGILVIFNASHATFTFYATDNLAVLDQFNIIKHR